MKPKNIKRRTTHKMMIYQEKPKRNVSKLLEADFSASKRQFFHKLNSSVNVKNPGCIYLMNSMNNIPLSGKGYEKSMKFQVQNKNQSERIIHFKEKSNDKVRLEGRKTELSVSRKLQGLKKKKGGVDEKLSMSTRHIQYNNSTNFEMSSWKKSQINSKLSDTGKFQTRDKVNLIVNIRPRKEPQSKFTSTDKVTKMISQNRKNKIYRKNDRSDSFYAVNFPKNKGLNIPKVSESSLYSHDRQIKSKHIFMVKPIKKKKIDEMNSMIQYKFNKNYPSESAEGIKQSVKSSKNIHRHRQIISSFSKPIDAKASPPGIDTAPRIAYYEKPSSSRNETLKHISSNKTNNSLNYLPSDLYSIGKQASERASFPEHRLGVSPLRGNQRNQVHHYITSTGFAQFPRNMAINQSQDSRLEGPTENYHPPTLAFDYVPYTQNHLYNEQNFPKNSIIKSIPEVYYSEQNDERVLIMKYPIKDKQPTNNRCEVIKLSQYNDYRYFFLNFSPFLNDLMNFNVFL